MTMRRVVLDAAMVVASGLPLPAHSPLERLLYRAIRSKRRRGRDADELKDEIERTFRGTDVDYIRRLAGFDGVRERLLEPDGYKHTLYGHYWPSDTTTARFRLVSRLAVGRGISFDILYLPGGEVIPPHGHDGVVSGMVVLDGDAGFRTYDVTGSVSSGEPMPILPRQAERCGPGGVSTSGRRENLHWIYAYSERLFLLRFTVSNLYGHWREDGARDRSRRYLLPTGRDMGDGREWAEPADFSTAARHPFRHPPVSGRWMQPGA